MKIRWFIHFFSNFHPCVCRYYHLSSLQPQNNTDGWDGSKVHLVGFSLGAQVSGIAGRTFPGVKRITGTED